MNIDGLDLAARPAQTPQSPPTAPKPAFSRFSRRWTGVAVSVDAASAIVAMNAAPKLVSLALPVAKSAVGHLPTVPMAMLLLGIFAALGLYAAPGRGPCERLRLRVQGIAILATAAAIATSSGGHVLAAGLTALVAGLILLVLSLYGNTVSAAWLAGAADRGMPSVVIGTDDDARTIAAGLLAHPEIGLRPVGFIALPNQPAVGIELPLPLLCRLDNASSLEPGIEMAVISASGPDLVDIETRFGPMPFRHYTRITDMKALHALRLRPDAPLASPAVTGNLHSRQAAMRVIKRAMDIALTLPFALLALPIAALTILAVKIADPGNAIYIQQRVGLNGRRFNVYKIRTMYQDAEGRLEAHLASDPGLAAEWKRNFKLAKDPRILRYVGHFLRRSSLDELPQLWNVLNGDMSLVGPRPFPAYHIESFDRDFQERRQSVIPGLTGLWQITVRSDGDLAAQREQDLLYIDNWSLWLDLKILLETPLAVLRGTGAK